MVNAETDSGSHQTSRRQLTVIIAKIISPNTLHQKFVRVLKFPEKHLILITRNISC